MKKKCESRLCKKMVDVDNCYSYITCGKKVFWCNKRCYEEHIGRVEPKEN